MRNSMIPTLLAVAMVLGGCASPLGGPGGLGGLGGASGGLLGQVLGSVLGGSQQGSFGNQGFQQAATNACGTQASRYGQVRITNVQQISSSTLRVSGTVATGGYQQRNFACSYRSDGTITDFDI